MQKSVQSLAGYEMLMSLIDVFEESEKDLTISEIEQALADKPGCSPIPAADEICSVLEAYSSDYLACPDDPSQVLCIFQNLGDQLYSLIASPETIDALYQKADALVRKEDLPVSVVNVEILTSDEEDKENAAPAAAGLYNQPIQDASDDPVRHIEAEIGYEADYSVYAQNANLKANSSKDQTLEVIEAMPADTAVLLDEANAAVLQARERAERAEKQNERLEKKVDRLQKQNEKMRCGKDKKQAKLDRKIQKAEDRIQQQYRKIEDHQEQIDQGSKQSLHKAQIRHDKKVIDRKERKIEKLTDQMAEENCKE